MSDKIIDIEYVGHNGVQRRYMCKHCNKMFLGEPIGLLENETPSNEQLNYAKRYHSCKETLQQIIASLSAEIAERFRIIKEQDRKISDLEAKIQRLEAGTVGAKEI